MQIVESTSFGVRSVVMTLLHPNDPVQFVLFPMIHIADPQFYREIEAKLADCDLILLEGVRSWAVSIMTFSYKFVAGAPRLGLVTQREMNLKPLQARVVRVDMSAPDFARGWSALRLPLRAFLFLAGPAYGLYLRFLGTREQIAATMGVDMLPTAREVLMDEDARAFMDLILVARDKVLLEHLGEARTAGRAKTVAIVYGAKHMRAVIRHLTSEAGYRIAKTEFVTVMRL